MAESASTWRLVVGETANLDQNRGGNVNKPEDHLGLLAVHFADTDTAWSIGSFGVIAEFMRDADEDVALQRADGAMSAITARGGLRLEPHNAMRPFASESLTTQSWSHRLSLCLPEAICAMDQRTVLTEIGPDANALRAQDRSAALFDLGLGTLQLNACIRSSDADVVAPLKKWTGRSLFEPGNGAMGVILAANPHRVFESRLGRIEVYQPIPPPDGKSPEGPHTHVLPRLLRHKRTHAATEFVRQALCHAPTSIRPIRRETPWGNARPFLSENRHASFQICWPASANRNSWTSNEGCMKG